MTSEQNQVTLDKAHDLITALEGGDNDAVSESLDALTRQHESVLFQELGKMTRELHESINNFKLDARISDLTETDIPDAKERLNYVITMTEDSANKTMDAVDVALPVSENIKNRAKELHNEWKRFKERDMSADQFRQLSKDLDSFFPMIDEGNTIVHENLTKILMAQDFQDLTGQIIRRVITLVQDVENSLVELVKIAGKRIAPAEPAQEKDKIKAEGPQIKGLDDANDIVSGQDDVDDLLSSLGF